MENRRFTDRRAKELIIISIGEFLAFLAPLVKSYNSKLIILLSSRHVKRSIIS